MDGEISIDAALLVSILTKMPSFITSLIAIFIGFQASVLAKIADSSKL
jgi:hypothetical protein